MPPTEEEISKSITLRENVVKNDAARGFLEARQTIDELLNTINHYLGMSIDLGRAPTPEEIEEARQRAMSAQTSCSCGGSCDKESCDCDGNCDHDHDHKDGAAAAATTKKAIFQPFVKRLHSQVKPFFIDGMRQRRPSRTCTYPVRHTPCLKTVRGFTSLCGNRKN